MGTKRGKGSVIGFTKLKSVPYLVLRGKRLKKKKRYSVGKLNGGGGWGGAGGVCGVGL